jgi:ABC-type multidrug transport system fused ATPase/permease subunit
MLLDLHAFVTANISVLISVSLILSVTAVVIVILLIREVRFLRQPFRAMAELSDAKGTERALEELLKGVDENRVFLQEQSEELKRLYGMFERSYSAIGLIKYNAFEDIGGMQSYSLCLLTREKNGVILTNLVGRNSTRGYALEVSDGDPSRKLSEEERKALETALGSIDTK